MAVKIACLQLDIEEPDVNCAKARGADKEG